MNPTNAIFGIIIPSVFSTYVVCEIIFMLLNRKKNRIESEMRELKNPADVMNGNIADAHRKIAQYFIEYLSEEDAVRIFKYFDGDTTKIEKHFNQKLGSYYMQWTPVHDKNIFISEWICSQIIDKVTDAKVPLWKQSPILNQK